MKEIKVTDLLNYINPLVLEHEPAIAIASDGKETNGLTIGWGEFGTLWRKPAATVYIHAARYSKHIFDSADYYSICFLKPENIDVTDYFGRVSGRDENKMEKCGLTVVTDDVAPYFGESAVVVLCRKMGQSDFDLQSVDADVYDWYARTGVHTQYYGEIVKVLISE